MIVYPPEAAAFPWWVWIVIGWAAATYLFMAFNHLAHKGEA